MGPYYHFHKHILEPKALVDKVFASQLTASTPSLLNWRTGIDLDITRSSLCWGWSHTMLNFCCHRHKCLLNICSTLRTCFQEWYPQWISIFLRKEESIKNFFWACGIQMFNKILGDCLSNNALVTQQNNVEKHRCSVSKQGQSHSKIKLCPFLFIFRIHLYQGPLKEKKIYLCCCEVHYFLCCEVTFVSHKKFINIFTSVSVDFL